MPAGHRGHVLLPCNHLSCGPVGLLCSRVLEVFIIIVIIIWAASGRLWLLQTLWLCCAAAGRRKRRHGMCFLLRQRLRRCRGGGLLQRFWRPCTDAARCGVANAVAANGRLWLLQTLRLRCGCPCLQRTAS